MFAKYFKTTTIGAAFDETIESAAKTGRVSDVLTNAIAVDFGLTFKGSPRAIALTLQRDYLTGKGAVRVAPAIHALHAALTIVAAHGVKIDVPTLSGTWADPLTLADAAEKRKAKAKATRAAKQAEQVADEVAAIVAESAMPSMADPELSIADAVSIVVGAIAAGDILPGGAAWAMLTEAMAGVNVDTAREALTLPTLAAQH